MENSEKYRLFNTQHEHLADRAELVDFEVGEWEKMEEWYNRDGFEREYFDRQVLRTPERMERLNKISLQMVEYLNTKFGIHAQAYNPNFLFFDTAVRSKRVRGSFTEQEAHKGYVKVNARSISSRVGEVEQADEDNLDNILLHELYHLHSVRAWQEAGSAIDESAEDIRTRMGISIELDDCIRWDWVDEALTEYATQMSSETITGHPAPYKSYVQEGLFVDRLAQSLAYSNKGYQLTDVKEKLLSVKLGKDNLLRIRELIRPFNKSAKDFIRLTDMPYRLFGASAGKVFDNLFEELEAGSGHTMSSDVLMGIHKEWSMWQHQVRALKMALKTDTEFNNTDTIAAIQTIFERLPTLQQVCPAEWRGVQNKSHGPISKSELVYRKVFVNADLYTVEDRLPIAVWLHMAPANNTVQLKQLCKTDYLSSAQLFKAAAEEFSKTNR